MPDAIDVTQIWSERKSKKWLEIMTDSTAAPTVVKTNCFRFLHLHTHTIAHTLTTHRAHLMCVLIPHCCCRSFICRSLLTLTEVIRAASKIIDSMLFASFKFVHCRERICNKKRAEPSQVEQSKAERSGRRLKVRYYTETINEWIRNRIKIASTSNSERERERESERALP